jgi:alpha-glucosidase (family GH31 glycosyl hydrolase)
MATYEYIPQGYALASFKEKDGALKLNLHCIDPRLVATFSFEVLRPNLFRTTFTTSEHPLPPHPSAVKPEANLQGHRPQASHSGRDEKTKVVTVGDVIATVQWSETPLVSLAFVDSPKPLHSDLPFRSYCIEGTGVSHYSSYRMGDLHVGLGEKAAPLDLSNRRFTISATDSFGYDVYKTDPLYKCIPLVINASPEGCVGVFYTSHARGMYSVGSEMDGLWGRYKVYRQSHGGLEQYLIIGRTLKDVVRTYAELVGYPRLVPRWAFGYIAGGMKYSMLDEPRAADALMDFARQLKQHDIPCSAFQMSSGYTVAETEPKTRNVFTWNKHRFPDPKGFIDAYHAEGIKLIANVKPYVLKNHPEYWNLAREGALFTDPRTGDTAVTRLWSAGGGESGEGSHIDFTSSKGFRWWYEGIKALKELGIDVPWDDNNEYTIPNDDWECRLDEPSVIAGASPTDRKDVGFWGRALHTELMGKASHDALVAVAPNERPFILTRSATAGTMRYCASSWSGDNYTSWPGMRGANALSLNAGLCLLQCYGHDIGGFEGPQPSAELLLRWVQLGCHSPRFAINCFKTSSEDNKIGDVIELWMYPEITSLLRKAIKRRYEMMPYIYSLHLESHQFASPPQRWVGWGYERDLEVWSEELKSGEKQYWLGDSLLVGGVYEPGVDIAKVYLPRSGPDDTGYLNLNPPYEYFEPGQWVEIASHWKDSIPLLAKAGTAIPVGKPLQTLSTGEKSNPANLPTDNYRGVEIFPPPFGAISQGHSQSTSITTWYEDDGISARPKISKFSVSCSSGSKTEILVKFEQEPDFALWCLWDRLWVILPVGEERTVVVDKDGLDVCMDCGRDELGRRRFWIKLNWQVGADS